jgi:hypothetical protein
MKFPTTVGPNFPKETRRSIEVTTSSQIYCEKPLSHSILEAPLIAAAAAKARVATQMGTQGHANPNYHRVVELIQTGAIGPVSEAHAWVSRAWGWQTPAEAKANQDIVSVQERPAGSSPVPTGLHWDLFLGPAPERPFHEVYWPGPKWYRWGDFGSGTMSDMGLRTVIRLVVKLRWAVAPARVSPAAGAHGLPKAPAPIPRPHAPADDVARASQFIRAHAGEWGIDPKRIAVKGRSSGGQVALSVSNGTICGKGKQTMLKIFPNEDRSTDRVERPSP